MKLSINRCPSHRAFWAITVDDEDGFGVRVTSSKCCGRWDEVVGFSLSPREWRELSELAADAADRQASNESKVVAKDGRRTQRPKQSKVRAAGKQKTTPRISHD